VTKPTEPALLGSPRPANVAELETALSALWRSLAEGAETRQAVTRACTSTLLLYVESEAAGREVGNLLGTVTLQQPCRSVVMIAEPQAQPAELKAWVSAHCHLPVGGERQVCCEQISIRAQGQSVRDLDNVVVPLKVPGLPVFLWWRAGRFAPPDYFDQILRVTDHVLVDSARFPEPDSDLGQLAEQVERRSGDLSFSDLNWARMTAWRELVAQCFDGEEACGYLDRLNRVRIEYEQDSPRLGAQGSQSLLLVGWLASRLKWQPEKPTGEQRGGVQSFRFRSAHGPVEVERVARRFEEGGKGVCFTITLEAGGTPPATFTLRRGGDGKNAVSRREVAGSPAIEQTVRLEVWDEAALVGEEIKSAVRDRIYEEALNMVARITAA
jgi:glucose-6-phosphate dehydrogenase assembly protein OpcA